MENPGVQNRTQGPTQERSLNFQLGIVPSPRTPPKPKLLDQVRQAIRTRHYSYMTEKAYVGWIKRFIFFYNKRHPAEMGEVEIGRFLSSLASDSHVSASTQNQALNALLFLYHEVLAKKIGLIEGVVRAKRPRRLPVVLTLHPNTTRIESPVRNGGTTFTSPFCSGKCGRLSYGQSKSCWGTGT